MKQKHKAAETQADFGNDPAGLVARYCAEIEIFESDRKKFIERGRKIQKRYRDDRDSRNSDARRFSLLWANVQTLKPALYGRVPKVDVQRRFKDNDPVSRVASEIAERVLDYCMDCSPRFDDTIRHCVEDYLLPGIGVAWQRYVPHMREVTPRVPVLQVQAPAIAEQGVQVGNDGASASYTTADGSPVDPALVKPAQGGGFYMDGQPYQETEYEEVLDDYVYWEDFGHNPGARTWQEVYCVWRKVYMTRAELIDRFGRELGSKITLDHEPRGIDRKNEKLKQVFKKACIYEIWDKSTRKAVWLSKSYADGPLDVRDDPLQLADFFPCPKPLLATTTNDSLEVVPDYAQYQDQAEEIDELTKRIGKLQKQIRLRGLYASSVEELKRLLQEGGDNDLIPVVDWMSLAEKGGLKEAVSWFPIREAVEALMRLYEAREQAKRDAFEVTGISDILRGETNASETATAQSIKAQWGSNRIRERQKDVQRFIRDILRIKFELVFNLFSDRTILTIINVDGLGQDSRLIPQAMQLLRNKALRHFRVDVETDSTIEPDEQAEKRARNEFLTAVGAFLREALPLVQASPQLLPMVAEMLMFAVRGYKAGTQLEAVIEQTMDQLKDAAAKAAQQPPPPDAAMADVERKKARDEQEIAIQRERMAMEREGRQADLQFRREEATANRNAETNRALIEKIGGDPGAAGDLVQLIQQSAGQTGEIAQALATLAPTVARLDSAVAALVERQNAPKTLIRRGGRLVAAKIGDEVRPIVHGADGSITLQ